MTYNVFDGMVNLAQFNSVHLGIMSYNQHGSLLADQATYTSDNYKTTSGKCVDCTAQNLALI